MEIYLYGRPKRFFITKGKGVGSTSLVAFDEALRIAGLGDYNLLRISSILPPNVAEVGEVTLTKGSLLPVVYGYKISSEKGSVISAAIAVAIPEDWREVGVIMEYADKCSEDFALDRVRDMVEQAMNNRGIKIKKILTESICTEVDENFNCVLAAVALW